MLNASPRKFVRFDPEGKFVSEVPLPQDMAPLLLSGSAMAPFGKHIIAAWGNEALALFEDEEYAVKLLDSATGRVTRTLRRPYPRVDTPPEDRDRISGGAMIDGQVVKRPAPKYVPDIVHLPVRGEELWVVTSTRIKEKGVLVDVFNRKGTSGGSVY